MFEGILPDYSIYFYTFIQRIESINNILPQSSGEFDLEANLELEKPPDPSEISIQMNLGKFLFRYGQKL